MSTAQLNANAPAVTAQRHFQQTPRAADLATGNRRRDLLAGHIDGAAFGAMVGLGETYLPAFVLAVGLGELMAGLVASLPMAVGGFMQLISPRMVHLLGSHKRWVLCCAAGQALSFVPLVLAARAGAISAPAVLLVTSLYWASGLAAGPAWNTWIGSIVAPQIRAHYFALRTRFNQAAVLACFVAGGLALHAAGSRDAVMLTFAAVFGAAGFMRLISLGALARQCEPVRLPATMQQRPLGAVARQFFAGSGSRLLVYIVCVQAIVQLSGPYFTPFMLRQLDMSYAQYMWLIAVAYAMRVAALPVLGRLAQRCGAARLLWIGGIGIVPLAGLWLVSDHFAWLVIVQMASGAAWAAYELAFFLLFFESIDESERTSVLTFYNFANTLAFVGGALIGGAILTSLGATYEAYLLIFGLSSVLRLGTLILLWRVPGVYVPAGVMGVRTLSVRPNGAALDAPILPSLPDNVADAD